MRTVLINGIGGLLGARIARLLSSEDDVVVLGLSRQEPIAPIGRADYLVARLNGTQLVDLLRTEQIDTVIHLDFAGAEEPAPNREAAVQQNVLGTMELFGACVAGGVQQVVLRSHTLVYGASPLNPTMISEHSPVARSGLSGLLRDYAEVEQFVADFAPRHPNIHIAILRCAPLSGAWSPLIHYFSQTNPRNLVGFDPSIQLLHLDDAAVAFAQAARLQVNGPYNLAADDTLRLSQAIRLAGQQAAAVFEPMVNLVTMMGDHSQLGAWPFDISFLRHSCIADTARARADLEWAPAHSAADSLRALRANGHHPADRAASEAALRAFLVRKR